MARITNTEQFIARAREIHGDKYDYSRSIYTNHSEKIEISCKKHGAFYQASSKHMKGQGCPECANKRPFNDAMFVEKAKAVHGEKYIYDKARYEKSISPVIIICRAHGEFRQRPNTHLSGSGCPRCIGRHKTTEDFIESAKSRHGDRYGYLKSRYTGSNKKLIVTCDKHGDFLVTPGNHVFGKGCPSCANNKPSSLQDFKNKAQAIHGAERYDYTDTLYINAATKTSIKCMVHGVFFITPNAHLAGKGCQLCPKRFSEPAALYVFRGKSNISKIGVARDPIRRLKIISRATPFDVSLHSFVVFENYHEACKAEKRLHKKLLSHSCNFTGFDGHSEWFYVDPKEAEALSASVSSRWL